MNGRSLWISLLVWLGACGSGASGPPGTWDVAATPIACTSTDTGAVTNDDPGVPTLLELRDGNAVRVTLDDGATIDGTWYLIPGDANLAPDAPGREASIDVELPEYVHAGALWSSLGLRLEAEHGDLGVTHATWQLVSSHATSVVHSMCTTTLVATRR